MAQIINLLEVFAHQLRNHPMAAADTLDKIAEVVKRHAEELRSASNQQTHQGATSRNGVGDSCRLQVGNSEGQITQKTDTEGRINP